MRQITQTNQFKRDYKKIAASRRHGVDDFLAVVVELLAQDKPLPAKHRDHASHWQVEKLPRVPQVTDLSEAWQKLSLG